MRVRIKRIDKKLPLPEYHTKGSVAFDLLSRETVEIPPQSIGRVPVNVIVEIPPGYMLLIKDRSSTARKKGLLCTIGFIDQDYCGKNIQMYLIRCDLSPEGYTFTAKSLWPQYESYVIKTGGLLETKYLKDNNSKAQGK